MFRTDAIDETYYARNNSLNFAQFGARGDFTDDSGRLYTVAGEDKRAPFYNKKFTPTQQSQRVQNCVSNSFGYVTLFVKLKKPDVPWFTDRDIGRPLYLMRGDAVLPVYLKAFMKGSVQRRTGRVVVKGLDRAFCNEILNERK